MNLKTKLSALLLTPILCLLVASPAAASFTIGQLHAPYIYAQCGDAVLLQTAVDPGSAAYWMPAGSDDGVITGWQTATGPNAGSAKLEVLRPTGVTGQYRVLATDGSYPVYANTFPSFSGLRIPVREGDAIGLAGNGLNCTSFIQGSAFTHVGFEGSPATGEIINQIAASSSLAVELSATVEIDADGDGYGDDSQDQCPGNAAKHSAPCSIVPPTPPTAASADTVAAPRIILRGRPIQAALRKGAVIEIAEVDQAASLRATGSLRIAGRIRPLIAGTGVAVAGQRTHLALRIPKAVKRSVRLALREGKPVRARVQVSAAGTSAGSGLATQTIAIGRSGQLRP